MNIDLARIGEILQARRVERGLSIAQISDALCLRKALIEAIEAGDRGPLPHEVYVRGFVKKYAAILHADDEIAVILEAPMEEEKVVEVVGPPPRSPKTRTAPRKFPRVRVAYLVGLAIVALCFFVYDRVEKDRIVGLKTQTAERVSEATQAQKESAGVRSVSEVSSVSEAKNSEEKSSLSAMSEPKRLMITCHERTWISAVIDGSEKKEFMLSPHEIIVLNAKERFDLLIGNAGGVKLILNGKDTEFSGKSGEVKRIDLS
jgi:cytoskeleton protein RodZ